MTKSNIYKEISKCQKAYAKLVVKMRLVESKIQSLNQKLYKK